MHTIIRCICGKVSAVREGTKKKCQVCGARLHTTTNEDGMTVPWAWLIDNSLEERKARGKRVKYDIPEAIAYIDPRHGRLAPVGGRDDEEA